MDNCSVLPGGFFVISEDETGQYKTGNNNVISDQAVSKGNDYNTSRMKNQFSPIFNGVLKFWKEFSVPCYNSRKNIFQKNIRSLKKPKTNKTKH